MAVIGKLMRVHVLSSCQGRSAVDEVRHFLTRQHIHEAQKSLHLTIQMALELHVWGPAFGLPSIDPECIAIVTYCQRVIPEGQWSLVASYDKSVGLTGVLRE